MSKYVKIHRYSILQLSKYIIFEICLLYESFVNKNTHIVYLEI